MYSALFYKSRRNAAVRSADVLVPLLLDLIRPRSVTDVGCGTGTWLNAARRAGVDKIAGVDGPWVRDSDLEIPSECFRRANLTQPWRNVPEADVVISLEVAEHLPRETAEAFVENLIRTAPVVVFSAAIPGQGGHLHVNEQWPSWWIPLFAARGYELFDVVRPMVWEDERISYWYRQNVMIFASGDAPAETLERLGNARRRGDFDGADLVHPEHALRSLQYPGLTQVLKAAPVAAVRSFAAAGSHLRELAASLRPDSSPSASRLRRRIAVTALAAVILAGGATAAILASDVSSRSAQQDLLAWYEENRADSQSELFYLNDIPHEDDVFRSTAVNTVKEENVRAIEQEMFDGYEDFFAVEEEDLDEFPSGSRMTEVGRFGEFVLFSDTRRPDLALRSAI